MPEKTNQDRIKEYLVGEKGYLKSNLSDGKVIMLSGKWGCGKTHFWQNSIQAILNDEKDKKPNHYISLYGKTSIQEIKNEIFLKVFESVDSFESEEKTQKVARSSLNLVSSLTKSISVFGMSLDLSEITDKSFKKLDTLLSDEKLKRTEWYLNSGAIICIDDFERKSKDIDLNDLFGFITQLTINFKCKVVIILNDDVFEGEEKKIFSNVKEKTVSKFLYYKPSIEELFTLIFDNDKYENLEEYKSIILESISKTEVLNARIYSQVLDNILEWSSVKELNKPILKCFVFININFILYHTVIVGLNDNICIIDNFENILQSYHGNRRSFFFQGTTQLENISFLDFFNHTKNKILSKSEESEELKKQNLDFLNINLEKIKSLFYIHKWQMKDYINIQEFDKINNFIETGILIDE